MLHNMQCACAKFSFQEKDSNAALRSSGTWRWVHTTTKSRAPWRMSERNKQINLRLLLGWKMAAHGSVVCKIGPSILNADLSEIYAESQRMLDSGADYLHLDVMDGHFVPNLTFGHPVVKCLRAKLATAFFDMHMMVSNPENWVEPMADAGANLYTFHIETTNDAPSLIRKIRDAGMKVGIAMKPRTEVETVLPYVEDVDMVLVMTVEPGFGGQKFMDDMIPKVQLLRRKFRDLDIEVDGGVGPSTIELCAEAGANMIVSGSAVIGNANPRQVINVLRSAVDEAIQKSQLER